MSNPLSSLSGDEIVSRLHGGSGLASTIEAYSAEMTRRAIVSIDEFNRTSSKYSKRLIFLTWTLIGLTVVIAMLTVKLVFFMPK